MKTINYLLTVFIGIFFLLSCKKETTLTEIKSGQAEIATIKNWYTANKPSASSTYGRDTTAIPTGDPEWDSIHSYIQSQLTKFVIPMRFDEENPKANQFVIIYINSNSEVVKSEYAYIILDSAASNNYTKELLEGLSPNVFEFMDIPPDLKGSIVKFNFNKELIASKDLSAGVATNEDLRFSNTPTSKVGFADCDCVEWWLET